MKLKNSEAGSIALEFSLIYSVLLALILTIVHFGLLYHVSLSASYGADAGLEALQSQSGSVQDRQTSKARVREIVEDLIGGGTLIRNLDTRVEFSGEDEPAADGAVTVRVSAQSPGLVPGLPTKITRLAHGQLERFRAEAER